MKSSSFYFLLGLVIFAVVLASQTFFIVDQRQQALVLQFGQPQGEPRMAGLHIKAPFIQTVVYFDQRVLSVDPPAQQMVISSATLNPETAPKTEVTPKTPAPLQNISGEPIIVDTFARYKITNPLRFLKTLRVVSSANSRLETILNDATRAVMGQTTLKALLSKQRSEIMDSIKTRVNTKIQQDQLGIEVVDVRIVRADLTPDLRTSTVRRMISELKERATETRAKGEELALEIRSTAEKERTVALAEAEQQSQIIKGAGDTQAIRIYAEAFNKDPEFYSFLRSMEAYKNTLSDPQTRLILSPDSPFFKHFGQP